MVSAGVASANRLVVLCGPTAVGKTALAVELAEDIGAEIIAADSRTVYRGLDIGTAKPTAEQRRRVPHHLLDVVDPAESFTVAAYQQLARRALAEIRGRGRVPLLTGGTGLYIRAVVDDLSIPPVAPDHDLRTRLEADERTHGPGHLHTRLTILDPAAAVHIHPRNVRRLIRALEVTLLTGQPISTQQQRAASVGSVVMVGLTVARAQLYHRIDDRIEAQLASGLIDETRHLLGRGIPADAPAMLALGYRELAGWLRGDYGYNEAVRRFKRNARRYAKRQLTWFRRDARIVWIDADDLAPDTLCARLRAIMDAEFSAERRA